MSATKDPLPFIPTSFNAYTPSEVLKFEYISVQVSEFYDFKKLPISNLFRLWETNIKVLIWK